MSTSTLTPALIYYNIEDFFDLSSIESMYRSQNDVDQNGITQLNYHSLTNNDQQFFDLILKRAASKAYEKLQVFRVPEANTYYREIEPDFKRSWGHNSLPEMTVEELNEIESPEVNLHYTVTDAGTLTLGVDLVVVANDIVYFDGTDWQKDNLATIKYIYYYLTLPVSFNQNNLYVIDDKVKEFITAFVIREWFKRQRYTMDQIVSEFEEISNELGRMINFRRSQSRKVRNF